LVQFAATVGGRAGGAGEAGGDDIHDERWGAAGEDPYAILGVPRDADAAEIASAYRALARRHHPDLAGEAETARMSRINAAFDLLRNPRDRRAFDLERGHAPSTRGARRPARHDANGHARPRSTDGRPLDPDRPPYGWIPERDGTGGAGPPPGRPSGSVLDFGRHRGWSIGEIARVDPGFLAWLEERREGVPYLAEIDAVLKRIGHRPPSAATSRTRDATRGRRFGWS
jgi:curved DNA-binding protein CbpA